MSEHGGIHSDTECFMAKMNCIKLDKNDYPTKIKKRADSIHQSLY